MTTHQKPKFKKLESTDSLPAIPKEAREIDKNAWSFVERQPPVLPVFEEEEEREEDTITPSTPPLLAFIKGHAQHFISSTLQFVFKDNNLPLIINIAHHLLVARMLIARSSKSVSRYLNIPSTVALATHSPLRHQIEQTHLVATDSFRAQGVLHLALGLLSILALKERRISSERSALLVLTLASAGQAWSHCYKRCVYPNYVWP
ncbi:hypothetical protein A0J61_09932 [Choanephora cucurbitarum]|uniref:Uncharacterized protein n=1 Tax=Choanephora cucurbitarum TaxID=101091 RepID=A0A1C7MZ29_9FUNG|nr:hypothetical protein A0J61_09932 [Choanephora cucurbitarum]